VNREEPYRDQAERLRRKIEKVKDGTEIENRLPSRIDVHRDKKNKTKWKLKFPIIRLLALFFILLPIVIFSAYSSLGAKKINTSEHVDSDVNGYEEIKLNDSNEENIVDSSNSIDKTENEIIIEEEQVEDSNEQSGKNDEVEDNSEKGDQLENTTVTSTENQQSESTNKEEQSNQEEMVYHKVQPNETLFRIAMNYYKSQEGIKIIQEANHLNGNEIKVGQLLKIPQ
jgi:LysM repeat protein